ncbi:MAG TPA: phosphoethanolamine transferase EptA, partial [Alphaproteobacteria bacterium]|nr:phosphoethanolamine transferase EptA [Alphaproteobacteria bacterium]
DNTLLYTSQNLADIIALLQNDYPQYNSLLIYISDHGESLGEYNVYLHSAPYVIAPKEQKHIPFFLWAADSSLNALQIDKQCLKSAENEAVSHDNIFHTLLGFGGISAQEYKQPLDLAHKCKK